MIQPAPQQPAAWGPYGYAPHRPVKEPTSLHLGPHGQCSARRYHSPCVQLVNLAVVEVEPLMLEPLLPRAPQGQAPGEQAQGWMPGGRGEAECSCKKMGDFTVNLNNIT